MVEKIDAELKRKIEEDIILLGREEPEERAEREERGERETPVYSRKSAPEFVDLLA
jgi:hypothetical protein